MYWYRLKSNARYAIFVVSFTVSRISWRQFRRWTYCIACWWNIMIVMSHQTSLNHAGLPSRPLVKRVRKVRVPCFGVHRCTKRAEAEGNPWYGQGQRDCKIQWIVWKMRKFTHCIQKGSKNPYATLYTYLYTRLERVIRNVSIPATGSTFYKTQLQVTLEYTMKAIKCAVPAW